ncbi:hypothetical protein L3X38_018365 [Prunus dulcis]|uniref:Retrotransposon gag domain-containing protein n=1 Tax=Prunus dulcis TaxID=3755 RepID=A0AAD4W929_PRUDU|nr:hypothetical protein L3X38_018365 [Prunus dulcis]
MAIALWGRCGTESSEIKRVKELGAREFVGSTNPAEAESWITEVERIFGVLKCPVGDRVHLATFLLKGNAYLWWKAVKKGYENPAAINWEEFQRSWLPDVDDLRKDYAWRSRALAQVAERVLRKLSGSAGRRRRDTPRIGGPSQGPSKRGGSRSSSARGRWSGGRGSSSSSGRSGSRPA